MKLSFIIPCYGSEFTVEKVIDEIINKVSEKSKYSYEIITVNDCSPDNVLSVLKGLAKENSNIKVIDFAKNMGKHSALMAGYKYCQGDIVIGVDDDYQCPVDRLWDLIEPLYNGYDVSIAKYGYKKESFFRNFGSYINGEMAHILIDKPRNLQLSNFVAMKKFVVDEILHYDNPYPYIDGLILRATQNIVNVPMEDRERSYGKSGYTLKKLIKQILNGFTAFSVLPLRIATITGIVFSIIGLFYVVYIIVNKIINPYVATGWSSMMAALLIVGGIILFMLGMIGEYIGRIYISINNSPQYVIREKYNFEDNKNVEK